MKNKHIAFFEQSDRMRSIDIAAIDIIGRLGNLLETLNGDSARRAALARNVKAVIDENSKEHQFK